MCCSDSSSLLKKTDARVRQLTIWRLRKSSYQRWRRGREAAAVIAEVEMEIMANLKLWSENCRIMAENEELRRRAVALCQENQVLLSRLNRFNSN